MTEPTPVFIVTYGEYSDYSIDHVFESREDAQAYVDELNPEDDNGGARVEDTYVLWPKGTRPKLVKVYSARATSLDGEITVRESMHDETGSPHKRTASTYRWKSTGEWSITASSTDRDWAVKAVADRQYAERVKLLPG